MTSVVLVVLGLALLVVVGLWLSWTATRLDQLHHRIELARESLNTQLAQRSAVTLELTGSGLLDDAAALLLADAAQRARRTPDRQAESDLSRALRAVLDEESVAALRGVDQGLLGELAAACHKVELARRFLNDQVTSARALRSRRRVRWFRLAGHAAEPASVDLDDVPPTALDSG